jgi:hypothetical protein
VEAGSRINAAKQRRKKMIHNLKSAVLVLGTIIAASSATPFAKADEWDKRTIITLNKSIQVKGKVLEPGQYVMKLLNLGSDRTIVQIFNRDENKLEMTILAIPTYRLRTTDDTELTLSEMPSGQPPALNDWFYPGDNLGLSFSETR